MVRAAIDERDDRGIRVSVSPGEDTFIAGEASAVISSLQGGAAAPATLGKPRRCARACAAGPSC